MLSNNAQISNLNFIGNDEQLYLHAAKMKSVEPGHGAGFSQAALVKMLSLPLSLLATASQVYPSTDREGAKYRLKYILTGLASARLTTTWFQILQEPGLASFTRLNPRILSKLQRPYIQIHLRPADRLKVLQEHYRFSLDSFATTAFTELLQRPGILLADIPLNDVGCFSLRLLYANKYEKEGELTLGLHDGVHREFVVALTFCISSFSPNPCEIFVGGLQGNQIADQRARVVAITRAMHGLRPKALLVFALHELAKLWNISAIRAVGNRNAVFRDPWIGDRDIHANYDQFWLECGGQQDKDGNFMLPARFVPRDLSTLAPTKRTLHRRRYEMLSALGIQIQHGAVRISKGTAE